MGLSRLEVTVMTGDLRALAYACAVDSKWQGCAVTRWPATLR
jgi:hypothetical protein